MRIFSSLRIVRVGLALAVALWMAGAGCLLGCENMVSAAAVHGSGAAAVTAHANNSLTIVAAGDACASMQSRNCCAGRGAKPAANATSKSASKPAAQANASAVTSGTAGVALGATSSTMMACPMAVTAGAALAKAKPDASRVALAQTRPGAVSPLREQATAQSSPLLLPNRGHTYLRCCVFLI